MIAYLVAETMSLFLIVYLTDWFPNWFGMPVLSDNEIRGLIYINVSISGQATIFSTRVQSWWFTKRPSVPLMLAFVVAQVCATILGILYASTLLCCYLSHPLC